MWAAAYGRAVAELRRQGVRAVGVDISQRVIERAQTLPGGRVSCRTG